MIYLDSAATALHRPPEVARAVADALMTFGNPGRGAHGAALSAARAVFETRRLLAGLFHASGPQQIAFAANATQALNTAIRGLLRPGDHAITTALEHNSVLRPLYALEATGMELTIVPSDRLGCIDYKNVEGAIRPNTRAIVCTHASNLTGNLVDLASMGKIAKTHGLLLIVDASQTAGVIDIDMQAMGIDVLCFTGHKGLMGPQGTGGLAVRGGLSIAPLLVGGSGVHSFDKSHPTALPESLEAGTLNAHSLAGLGAALEYLNKTGLDAIRAKERSLMRAFYEGASSIPGVTVYGDFSSDERCAIVSLNIRDYDSTQVSDVLAEQYGIATRPGAHCAPLLHQALGTQMQGAVRFSFSPYNTEEEVAAALRALRELSAE